VLDACPEPLDPHCECPVYESLRYDRERVYGGVKHVSVPSLKTQYRPLLLEVNQGVPTLKVDRTQPAQETA